MQTMYIEYTKNTGLAFNDIESSIVNLLRAKIEIFTHELSIVFITKANSKANSTKDGYHLFINVCENLDISIENVDYVINGEVYDYCKHSRDFYNIIPEEADAMLDKLHIIESFIVDEPAIELTVFNTVAIKTNHSNNVVCYYLVNNGNVINMLDRIKQNYHDKYLIPFGITEKHIEAVEGKKQVVTNVDGKVTLTIIPIVTVTVAKLSDNYIECTAIFTHIQSKCEQHCYSTSTTICVDTIDSSMSPHSIRISKYIAGLNYLHDNVVCVAHDKELIAGLSKVLKNLIEQLSK